jgi:NADH:ubiquinone oxidoreductase subunit 6 (subunit J)
MGTWALFAADSAGSGSTGLGDLVRNFWPILIPVVLGFAAVALLLPRARSYPPLWGAVLGGLGLVLAGWWVIRAEPTWEESALFYAFSAIAVVAGTLLVTQRNPVRAALSFALVVLSTCGLFLLQAAPFLMAATVIIYAGAIIVTFLFVLMLAQQAGLSDADQRSREPLLSAIAGFVLLGGLLCVLQVTYRPALVQSLLEKFDRAEQAGKAQSVDDIRAVLGNPHAYFQEFRDEINKILRAPREGRAAVDGSAVKGAIDDAEQGYEDANLPLAAKTKRFREVAALRVKTLYLTGSLQPSGRNLPLSAFSGVRPNLPAQAIPRDAEGRAALPQANVEGLGRALFTDFVIAVELAGTLLLVAVIGAIAIVGRRAEGLR